MSERARGAASDRETGRRRSVKPGGWGRLWIATASLAVLTAVPGPTVAAGVPSPDDASVLALAQESPADSLYRAARSALNREEYRKAARLFGRLAEEHADSEHGPDALYWRAFSLYRLGDAGALREARAALRHQQEVFPEAAARSDNQSLLVRVQGKLAERGDPEAARQVVSFSDGAVQVGEGAVVRLEDGAVGRQGIGAGGTEVTTIAFDGVAIEPLALEAELARMEMEGIRLGRMGEDVRELAGVSVTSGQAAADSCDGNRAEMRAEALHALYRYDEGRALRMIEKVLADTDPCAEELRETAVYLLSRYEPGQSRALLLEAARQDPSGEVREQALHALARLDPTEALPVFREILQNPADSALHETAVHAAWRVEGEASEDLLRSVAGNPEMSREVRENAVWGLARRGGPESRQFLRDLFGQVEDTEIKERILFGLLRTEEAAGPVTEWALEVATDASQPMDVREAALYLAGRKEAVPMDRLFDLYDRIGEADLKERLIVLFARRESREARDRLIQIARTEEDPELRRSAVFWLARSGDERAADVLEEIIAPPDTGR